jgi:hypothetical protein
MALVPVLHALRQRLDLPGRVEDFQILEIAIADGLFGARDVHEFMQSRQLLFDLQVSKQKRLANRHRSSQSPSAMSLGEWQALYSACGTRGTSGVTLALQSREGLQMLNGVEDTLHYTLKESDQAARWKQPLVRMLVFLALATEESAVERVASVLGAVVLTDHRRIEDFRARLESAGPSVLLLASCISCVVGSVGLAR